jgi:hypothetical protein
MAILKNLASVSLLLFMVSTVSAQNSKPQPDKPPIQDNSFLLEEAYNQEDGVIQHINTFMRQRGGLWAYTFTQEWPVTGQKHQLSYTIPVQRVAGTPDFSNGLGDVAINYRYQLLGSGKTRVAFAPRFSLLLPTGDSKKGLGAGAVGYQFNFPVSLVVADKLVTHINAGATLTPSTKNAIGEKANTSGFNLGQSLIWLTAQNFNVMVEAAWNSSETVTGQKLKQRGYSFLLNPGIRWAHNFKSGLQIVPGIAVPLGLGPSNGDHALFFYLSFEHPLKKNGP